MSKLISDYIPIKGDDEVTVSLAEYEELLVGKENWQNLCQYVLSECSLSTNREELTLPYAFGDAMIMFIRFLEPQLFRETFKQKKNAIF